MAAGTAIEWTDATWSPVTGCTRVSPGCEHCYIERTPPFRMAGRVFVSSDGEGGYDDSDAIGSTTGVQLHPDRLGQPLRWRKPRRIFVCSMADLFHADVPDAYIARVWATMALAQQHTFQVLTKRPARARALLSSGTFQRAMAAEWITHDRRAPYTPDPGWPLPNVWLGVSAENDHWAYVRIPVLLDTPAAVRWVSAEPLLGPVSLHRYLATTPSGVGSYPTPLIAGRCPPEFGQWMRDIGLDWVVVGGESGPGARPMHPRWVRELRDQCYGSGVPFLFKQWGEWAPGRWKTEPDAPDGATHAFTGGLYRDGFGRLVEHFMEIGHRAWSSERDDHAPQGAVGMYRPGKKAAGRELDGAVHDSYPVVAS